MEIKSVSYATKWQIKYNSSINEPKPEKLYNNLYTNNSITSLPKYNNSYTIAFMGKTDYTENEMDFLNLRRKLARKNHKTDHEFQLNDWNYYTNSTEENEKKQTESFSKCLENFSDKDVFEKLKEIKAKGISNPKLLRSFDDLYKDYEETITYKPDIEALQKQETSVQSILNTYRGKINGQEYTNGDLDNMLLTEHDPKLREQVYIARRAKCGDLVAPKLLELVKARNEFAHKLGYSDYFSYKLERNYKLKDSELTNLISDVDTQTADVYNVVREKQLQDLARVFNTTPDKLQPWHYKLELGSSPVPEFNKYYKSTEDLTKIAFSIYKKMGWDIEKLPITLDLFPREGKNQHGFSFDIDKNRDARILANLRPDLESQEILLHELGHSVYDIGLSSHIPYFDQEPASSAMTEAFAMMNETIARKEGILPMYLNIPKELTDKLELKRLKESLDFVRFCLQYITFEKQMYANPDQDLPKLWYDLEHKYLNRPIPEKLDNRWASERMHIVSYPAYYQNYFRAEIMSSQLYEAASSKLGKLTENPNTATMFRTKLFRFGKSLTENELLKKFSGKELSVTDYCKQFERLLHQIK